MAFRSEDENGTAIYHTNVMMCLGDEFAVICLESIPERREKIRVVESLESSGKKIVDISLEQMNQFAGNMLLLQNKDSKNFLAMSKSAHNSLKEDQIRVLETFATLTAFDIETIEACGGGSVRCMIAEIF